MAVLGNILDYTHLWNEIRIAGGAYGCDYSANPYGDLFFYTYRDPDPANSIGVFKTSGAFIRDHMRDDPDLTGYILSSVSSVDPLRTPEQAITAAETRFFTDTAEADIERRYRELLSTKPSDIAVFADMLDRFAAAGFSCIAADKETIEKAAAAGNMPA